MSWHSSYRRIWLFAAVGVAASAGGLLGLSISASAQNASANTPGITVAHRDSTVTIDSTVGDSGVTGIGAGAKGCTSAAPDQVACGVPHSTSTVKYWCLAATPPGGVMLTFTASDGTSVNPVTVNCAVRPVPTVGFPGTIRIPLFTATSEYENESCSTDISEVRCSTPDSSNIIDVTCRPDAPQGIATVTVEASDPVEVRGKAISFGVNCPGGTPVNVSSTVGLGGQVNVGGEVEDCTSDAPDQVGCAVSDSGSDVKYWCLNPTPPSGVIITDDPSEDAPVASVTVKCAPGGFTITKDVDRIALFRGTKYEAESCDIQSSLDGVQCTTFDSSNVIKITCDFVSTATMTVTSSDPSEIAGKKVSLTIRCE